MAYSRTVLAIAVISVTNIANADTLYLNGWLLENIFYP